MSLTLALVVVVVAVALVFGWTNGFHDAANAVATPVATRALTPRVALLLAAVMNFTGALLGQEVARTVADVVNLPGASAAGSAGAGGAGGAGVDVGLVHHGLVVVLAALVGAIAWNLLTWWRGMPTSSTQALLGALVGAALAAGVGVRWSTVVGRAVVPMLALPVVGFALAFAAMTAFAWLLRRRDARRVRGGFRFLQTFSAALLALGHGLQDAQKTIGVILLALVAAYPARYDVESLPVWVVLASAAAISLGTAAGGWRIVRTLGRRLTDLDPARAFTAETVGAGVLYVSAYLLHAPVSTTQTVTAAVVGAGVTRRRSAVRWEVVGSVALGWALTVPAAALVAFGAYHLLAVVLL